MGSEIGEMRLPEPVNAVVAPAQTAVAAATSAVTQPATPSGTVSSIPTGDNASPAPSTPSFIGGVLSDLTPGGAVGSGPSDQTGGLVDSGAPNAAPAGSPIGLYLLIAGLAVAAYFLYKHYKKKHERGGEHGGEHAAAA